MYFRIRDLCEELQEYSKIVIYGIGAYAKIIYPYICDMGLKDRICCCVVTASRLGDIFYDQQVCSFTEIYNTNLNAVILVAVSEAVEKDILVNLKQFGFDNYILLSNFEVRDDSIILKYKNQSFNQYMKYIAEWYEYVHIEETKRLNRTQIESKIIAHRGIKKNNQIVIVSEMLHTRHYYIFETLIKKGFELILLVFKLHGQEYTKQMVYGLDLKVITCQTVEEVLYWSLQFNPLIYYIIPRWSNALLASIMIQHKQCFGKLVLEIVDIMNGCYNVDSILLETEKYALENADGIVWRFFAKEYLEEEYGFQYKGKSIQFIDCCSGDYHREIKEDDILKLCMIHGGCYGLVRNEYEKDYVSRGDNYIHFLTVEEIMEGITDREDVVLHIYIGYATQEEKKYLQIMQEKYSNLKVYYNVSYNTIKEILPGYDYGIENIAGKTILTDTEYKQQGCKYLSGMYMFAVSQKDFDYIDAGLGITATVQKLLGDYLRQYDIVVGMDGDKLDIEYLKNNKKKYRKNAEKAREILHIRNCIDNLLLFFDQL